MASEGGQRGSGVDGVRPGQLSALLQEIAAAPTPSEGGWGAALLPGAAIGKFELVREIGSGGFGVVWEARDRELGRSVAFKAVRAGGKAGLREERLLREAEAAARLSHPNLVTLFDMGRSEAGPYLVMELLAGQTLEERLAQGPLPLREAVRIAAEVARGAAHAHRHGVVHRDLKPANVFLCEDGQVKVLDFGLAHAFGQRRQDGGTPAYMAPEQWEGAPEDERTDVFALGVMLYRMLAGELPFPDDEGRAVCGPGRAPAVEVPDAPALGLLVARLLEKRAAARPRDGAEVASALRSIQGELERTATAGAGPVTTRPQAGLPGLLAELRRRRVVPAMVGYGTFALLAVRGVDWLAQTGRLPGWAVAAALALLGLGLPLSLFLAWTYDLTGQGVRRTAPASTGASQVGSRRLRQVLLLSGLALLAAVPGAAYYAFFREGGVRLRAAGSNPAPAGLVTLAVLPLMNLSGDPSQDYFSDGMTEEIIGKLSRLQGLAVTARSNVTRYKGSAKGARDIGRELGVAYLVEGSVRRAGERIRITATLVKAADGFHVWSEAIDARLDDVFDAQERVATRIVEALHLRLSPAEAGSLGRWGTRNVAAYDEYLRGQVLVEHFHQRDKLEAARGHFERALQIDPQFAPAMAGLASAEAQTYRNSDSTPERLERAQALVARALAVDAGLVRARFASGEIRAAAYDYQGAAERFREVTVLEPRNHLAWDYLCWALGYVTPPEAAEAEKACRRAIEINPAYGESYYHLARVLIPQGRLFEAEQALAQLAEHFPDSYLVRSGQFWLHLGSGRPREALAALAQDHEIMGTGLGRAWEAMALAPLGELDRAFVALDEAMARGYRDAPDLRTNRYFEPLRRDRRFARLLAKHRINLGPGVEGAVSTKERRPEPDKSGATPSIAVLPFVDMSPGKDQEYFADGVAEEILNALAQVDGLRVVGRTSSWYFKGRSKKAADIGRELRVGALLEGSVRRDGQRLRIAAKLVAVPDGRSLWSESYDRELGDVFALQEGIARSVVGALQVKLVNKAGVSREAQRTTPEAYLQHLLGYQLWARGAPGDIQRSVEAFEKALAIDPGYAPAWAGLAWSLEALAGTQPGVAEVLATKRRALEAAERAVERGPAEARAFYARGGLRAYHRHEWREALADLERALALRPSDGAVHRVHGWILEGLGRLPEALAALRRATDLEPLSARGWAILARLHKAAGDHASARAAYARIQEIAPEHQAPQVGLALLAILEGRPAEALPGLGPSVDRADRLWVEALAEHSLGRDAESRKALAQLKAQHAATSAYDIGAAHAWRGEAGEAISWLERADAQLDWGIMSLKNDPFLASLHSDPRWKALLRKMNLPLE